MTNRIYVARGPEWYELWLTKPKCVHASTRDGIAWRAQNGSSTGYVTLISEASWKRLGIGIDLEPGQCAEASLAISALALVVTGREKQDA